MRRYESYSMPISFRTRDCSTSRVSPGDQLERAMGNGSMLHCDTIIANMWRAFLLIACAAAASAQPAPTRRIPLTGCKAAGGRAEALCGTYEVFENRAAQTGRKIKLNLMVVPAANATPEPDPVFLLAGGPGEGAVQTFQGMALQFRQKRDVVLVDQRGAGQSNRLTC